MGVEKAYAKNAEVQVCVRMESGKITARNVEVPQYVIMESARIFAKNAEVQVCANMVSRSKRAKFAVRYVLIAK